jgi:hypothetical protein
MTVVPRNDPAWSVPTNQQAKYREF